MVVRVVSFRLLGLMEAALRTAFYVYLFDFLIISVTIEQVLSVFVVTVRNRDFILFIFN